jgi:hypothetical protein
MPIVIEKSESAKIPLASIVNAFDHDIGLILVETMCFLSRGLLYRGNASSSGVRKFNGDACTSGMGIVPIWKRKGLENPNGQIRNSPSFRAGTIFSR